MRAGRLRHQLAIYSVAKSTGVSGAETLTLLGTFPAEIAPMGGKEYAGLGGTANTLSYKITMRYIRNITTAHIGVWEGKRFRFQAVICPEERRSELQIVAVESK